MVTQHTHKPAGTEPPKGGAEPGKPEEVKPQNPLEAPVPKRDQPPPAVGTWQAGFLGVADSLDALGMHWLGNILRTQVDAAQSK